VNVAHEWRGGFGNAEVNLLHAEAFGHPPRTEDWWTRVNRHSLGWVCARDGAELLAKLPDEASIRAIDLDAGV
jgi:hypothetical protein